MLVDMPLCLSHPIPAGLVVSYIGLWSARWPEHGLLPSNVFYVERVAIGKGLVQSTTPKSMKLNQQPVAFLSNVNLRSRGACDVVMPPTTPWIARLTHRFFSLKVKTSKLELAYARGVAFLVILLSPACAVHQ